MLLKINLELPHTDKVFPTSVSTQYEHLPTA